MIISEIFGPTLQGEGPSAGRPCGFVRLGRCNLTCSWCDTPYTWDWKGKNGTVYDPASELVEQSVVEVASELLALDVPMVVITGGEPLIQRKDLTELAQLLSPHMRLEIETNGTLPTWPDLTELVDQFNVSLKLTNSGVEENKRLVAEAIQTFPVAKTIFKFVVTHAADVDEIERIQQQYQIDNSRIWVMPEGRTTEEIEKTSLVVAPLAINKRWSLSTRLQVQLWGDQRGV